MPLQAGKWLHITYVHKDKKTTVYVNGKVQKVFENSAITFGENSMIVVGNSGYRNDYLREIRLWDKALTESEINDYLYLPMDPATPASHFVSATEQRDGDQRPESPRRYGECNHESPH